MHIFTDFEIELYAPVLHPEIEQEFLLVILDYHLWLSVALLLSIATPW